MCDRALAGLARPQAFAWFSRHYITGGLALTMLAMGTSLKLAVRGRGVSSSGFWGHWAVVWMVGAQAKLFAGHTDSQWRGCLMRCWKGKLHRLGAAARESSVQWQVSCPAGYARAMLTLKSVSPVQQQAC